MNVLFRKYSYSCTPIHALRVLNTNSLPQTCLSSLRSGRSAACRRVTQTTSAPTRTARPTSHRVSAASTLPRPPCMRPRPRCLPLLSSVCWTSQGRRGKAQGRGRTTGTCWRTLPGDWRAASTPRSLTSHCR